MRVLYTFGIYFYLALIRVAALTGGKARLWLKGRKSLFPSLKGKLEGEDRGEKPMIWVHCSSLGEFEQGRPVIEKLKTAYPQFRVLLTFFSPSGYEIRKNYEQADYVSYLPLDTPANARKFIRTVRPVMAIFVKYDYWFNFLKEIRSNGIPVIFISAVFRTSQYFFRWYGSWFRRQLDAVTWFFVQDERSRALLRSIGRENVSISGDTRFDRVAEIARIKKEFPLIEQFCGEDKVFIAGSTWEEDDRILIPFIRSGSTKMKFIVAPHDTARGRIRDLAARIGEPVVLYSELTGEKVPPANILLIDSIGILAQLYRYAHIAYIGGGFGTGIHNIQEPITFGVPVFFGPGFHKFREAADLISLGGVFSIRTGAELSATVLKLLTDPGYHSKVSEICLRYVDQNKGATEKIFQEILKLGLLPHEGDQGSYQGPRSKTDP